MAGLVVAAAGALAGTLARAAWLRATSGLFPGTAHAQPTETTATTPAPPPATTIPIGQRNEARCRALVRHLLVPHDVVKVRPPWLRNPQTGRSLELDLFCPDRMVAVEYNGSQHYVQTELHRDAHAFAQQRRRDALKKRLCTRHGVKLIVVPYTQRFRMEAFLRERLAEAGVRCNPQPFNRL